MPYYMHPMPYHPGMMHGFYPGQQCGYPGVMPQNLPSSIPKEASKKKIYVQQQRQFELPTTPNNIKQ